MWDGLLLFHAIDVWPGRYPLQIANKIEHVNQYMP